MDGLPAGERYSFQSPPSRLNGIPSSKVHVIGRDIAQGLVVATPVVVLDKPRRSRFPASRECPKQSDGCVPCKSDDGVQSSHWSAEDRTRPRSVTSRGHFLTRAWSHRSPRAAPAAVNYCLLNGGTPPSQAPQLSFSSPYLCVPSLLTGNTRHFSQQNGPYPRGQVGGRQGNNFIQ